MTLLLYILVVGAFSAEPVTYPGHVRVEGPDATGNALRWDPKLSELSAAYDRELAWAAVANLETRAGAWYQRVWGLRALRMRVPLDAAVLDADRASVEAFLRERGWPTATVALQRVRRDGTNVEDISFVTRLEERQAKGPIAADVRPPEPGWQVSPLVNALGRGAFASVYVGVHADWLQDAANPEEVILHGEAGVRAFPDPESDVFFGGNVGPWTDVRIRGVHGIGEGLGLFAEIGAQTNLWPAVGEGNPEVGAGLLVGRFSRVHVELATRFGRWASWHWEGQRARYSPWFDGTPLGEGQARFYKAYTYGRLDLTLVADSTDRKILPRHGARVAFTGTPFALSMGQPFMRGDLDARAFVPLGSQRWVWGTRVRGGVFDYRDVEGRTLLGERFFLGALDMRAWGFRHVQTPGYAGDAYDLRPGGNLLTYFNSDLAWHLHRDLVLVAFVDVGRVWEEPDEVALDQLLTDVGVSAAANLIGSSLRLDVAYRPTLQASDRGGHVGLQLWLDMPW